METVYTSAMAAATPTASSLDVAPAATSSTSTVSPELASLLASNPYLSRIEEHGPYGYEPILWLPILFSGLYALSALLHVAQVSSTRHWWLLVLVFGCIAESAGNGIRIYGHFDAKAIDPYIAQQVILVVTPVFFAAVHFATLGRIIELFGQAFTFRYLSPAAITPCFVLLDLASLAVQGTGSGMAATAEVNGKDTTWGGRIVVIGLCVQLVGYACFNWLLLTFVWRAVVTHHSTVSSNRLWTGKFKFFLLTFFLSSLLVLGRSTFRTYEMIKGWVGPISTVEWYFYAFDAAPVCAASLLLNLMFPGWVLPSNHRETVEELATARAKVEGKGGHDSFDGSFCNVDRDADRKGGSMDDDRFSIYASSVKYDMAGQGAGGTVPHHRTNSLGVPLHKLPAASSSTLTLANNGAPMAMSKSYDYAHDGEDDYYAPAGRGLDSATLHPSPSAGSATFGWSHPRVPSPSPAASPNDTPQLQSGIGGYGQEEPYRNSARFSSGAFAM